MYRVLIVDDMDIMRKLLKRMKLWGFETGFEIVAEAENGSEALKIMKEQTIDVVITDIRMPKIDGLELLQQITSFKMCKYVILVSEYAEFEYAKKGIQYGAYGYIVKPVDEQELKTILFAIAKELSADDKNSKQVQVDLNKVQQEHRYNDLQTIKTYMLQAMNKEAIASFTRLIEGVKVSNTDNTKDVVREIDIIYRDLSHFFRSKYPWLQTITDIDRYSELMDGMNMQQELDQQAVSFYENIVQSYISEMVLIMEQFQYTTGNNPVVQEAVEYILSHIDDELTVAELAKQVHVNISYLSNLFRQKTKMTIKQFLVRVKIERTKKLLVEGKLKTYEIAETLGYKDYEYFTKVFKNHTGLTPTQFRQNQKKSGNIDK